MKLIKPYTEIWEQGPGLEDMLRHIERCARVCYKSEDHIKEGTTEKMVKMLIDRGHTAMLEHGTAYLEIDNKLYDSEFGHDAERWNSFIRKYQDNPYSRVNSCEYSVYITTNYRVLVENDWLDDLKYLCEPAKFHEKRITVKFVCDRGISHELVRHRVFSFAQESTRYCNYSKDKFGNELTYIEPCWLKDYNYSDNTYYGIYLDALTAAEAKYFDLLKQWDDKIPDRRYKTGFRNNPWTPQQARSVLPNSLKTEVCMTGFKGDWDQFFELRCDKAAHPQMRELAIPLKETFQKEGLIK